MECQTQNTHTHTHTHTYYTHDQRLNMYGIIVVLGRERERTGICLNKQAPSRQILFLFHNGMKLALKGEGRKNAIVFILWRHSWCVTGYAASLHNVSRSVLRWPVPLNEHYPLLKYRERWKRSACLPQLDRETDRGCKDDKGRFTGRPE